MKKNVTSKNGFTLIELLLVIALMSLAVGVTGDILVSLIRSYNKSTVLNEIEQNANFVSQKLNKELRNASQIVSLDSTNPTCDFPPEVGCEFNEITFTDRSGTNDIVYKVNGGIITRDSGDSSDDPLTNNVPPLGVTASCLDANDECVGVGGSNACFRILEDAPQVVKIAICIEQACPSGSCIFEGDIKIVDTVVIRDTY